MGFFIKKIFEDCVDNLVHLQFSKFSRGEFRDRAMVVVKSQAKGYRISTGPEYANDLVRYFAEKLGESSTQISGVIITTLNLDDELDFDEKKLAIGIRKYIFDREMTGSQILELCDKYPNCFIGFSFSVNDSELKIKPKAPKSGRPSTKTEEKPKVDFCKIKTSDTSLIEGLVFDSEVRGYKQVEVSHDFFIDEIVVSEELKAEAQGDYKKIKDMALRKGKLVRKLDVDGKQVVKEKEIEV